MPESMSLKACSAAEGHYQIGPGATCGAIPGSMGESVSKGLPIVNGRMPLACRLR